jgi:thiol-disulfide isomerase/thioredoxin
MKNNWKIISLLVMTGIGLIYCSGYTRQDSSGTNQSVHDLPMLSIVTTDGNRISLRETPDKTVLIYFNPDCDHCQREAAQIGKRKQVFENYTVFFISIDSMENIVRFANDYNLLESNFQFGQANSHEVAQAVGPLPSVPAIFIYNNKKLVKRLEGEVKLEEIMKFL